jgi:DNA invertase Pin-like site-specific DNA recombinase
MATPKRAGIYCRLSYAPDGSLEKVERQEADCRALADRLAWPVSNEHIYPDNNRSAWQRNRKRPQWDRMLAAIDAGEIDAVVIYHGDRLIRQPFDLETLLNVADSKGVRIASPSGTRDLDNADDRFILRIEAAQACKSSDDTSRRVRRGWEARAKQGLPVGGGKRPFGFEPDTTTRRESECEILAEAVDRLLAGQNLGGVLRWMDTVSTTSQGKAWTSKTLKNLLTSPRIAGLVEHEGTLYEAVWKPIISVETWEDVKGVLARLAEENPYPGRERRYLLSGVAVCPTGHPVRVKPSGGRNRKTARLYWCATPGCPTRVGRNLEHLDRYVEARAVRRLNDKRFIASLHAETDRPGVGAEISVLERRKAEAKAQLEDLADHPDLDAGLLARSLASFDRKISDLRAVRDATARQQLLSRMAGITREQWDETPVDVRSATVAALFSVTILPATWRGPGFDPASVRLEPVTG